MVGLSALWNIAVPSFSPHNTINRRQAARSTSDPREVFLRKPESAGQRCSASRARCDLWASRNIFFLFATSSNHEKEWKTSGRDSEAMCGCGRTVQFDKFEWNAPSRFLIEVSVFARRSSVQQSILDYFPAQIYATHHWEKRDVKTSRAAIWTMLRQDLPWFLFCYISIPRISTSTHHNRQAWHNNYDGVKRGSLKVGFVAYGVSSAGTGCDHDISCIRCINGRSKWGACEHVKGYAEAGRTRQAWKINHQQSTLIN